MGSMGSSRHMKRSAAPSFWKIPRKEGQFALKQSPGPHPISESYSLATFLRDVIKVVKTMRGARSAIDSNKIIVDGVVRRDAKFPVGLMDVVNIPSMGKIFRLLPRKGSILFPVIVDSESAKMKLCRVKSKMKVRGNIFSYGLHDGRTILSKEGSGVNVDDSLLISIPENKIVSNVKMDKGSLVIFLKGKASGKLGVVNKILPGGLTSQKSALVDVEGSTVKVPVRILLAVGAEKPLISLGGE
jgi:small subunit ribosomal protein S4e